MRFTSLASGSSGNCTYIGSDQTHILVDAGISCKRINESLNTLDIKTEDLSGIMITHEHSDHIQGLRVISKKFHVPIYGTIETLRAIKHSDRKGEIDESLYRPVLPDQYIGIGDTQILPFSNSHDAANPVGYRIEQGRAAAAVLTDLGVYSQYTISHLLNLSVLLLEANHDIRMLETGPYPYPLKRRILGSRGHLSNEAAGQLLTEILHDNMVHIMLGHISQENNYDDLAYETVCCEVNMSAMPYQSKDFRITLANRNGMSEVIHI